MTDENLTLPAEDATPNTKKPKNWAKLGLFFIFIGLSVFIIAFAIGYFQLASQQIANIQNFVHLDKRISATQNQLQAIDKSVQNLTEIVNKYQSLSQQQAQFVQEWQTIQKGEIATWQRKQVEYLVRMANEQLQLNHNIEAAIILLQQADQTLQQMSDASLLPLRQAITNDLTTLQNTPKVDITTLYLKLVALDHQIDSLPLPVTPLQAMPSNNESDTENLSWWRRGLHQTGVALRKLIIVQRLDQNNSPLVLPNEKAFLYQNLHSRMEQVLWAVLNRNQSIYKNNLTRIHAWIQTYFRNDDPLTENFLQSIQELSNVNLEIPALNLNATLQLFEQTSASSAT